MRSYLQERDKARDDGDKLAVAVKSFLQGKLPQEDLGLALMAYCQAQGWNGPAMSWVKDIIDWGDE
jgi:hypothetical protein